MKFTPILAMMALASGAIAQTTTEDPGPSPTASVGCEPHGDHWHCDGPASTAASASASASASSSEETTSSVTPTSPSPTESVGCEPHGDHWHCDGPAETGSSTESASDATETGAAGMVSANLIPVFGLAAGVAAFCA